MSKIDKNWNYWNNLPNLKKTDWKPAEDNFKKEMAKAGDKWQGGGDKPKPIMGSLGELAYDAQGHMMIRP